MWLWGLLADWYLWDVLVDVLGLGWLTAIMWENSIINSIMIITAVMIHIIILLLYWVQWWYPSWFLVVHVLLFKCTYQVYPNTTAWVGIIIYGPPLGWPIAVIASQFYLPIFLVILKTISHFRYLIIWLILFLIVHLLLLVLMWWIIVLCHSGILNCSIVWILYINCSW